MPRPEICQSMRWRIAAPKRVRVLLGGLPCSVLDCFKGTWWIPLEKMLYYFDICLLQFFQFFFEFDHVFLPTQKKGWSRRRGHGRGVTTIEDNHIYMYIYIYTCVCTCVVTCIIMYIYVCIILSIIIYYRRYTHPFVRQGGTCGQSKGPDGRLGIWPSKWLPNWSWNRSS